MVSHSLFNKENNVPKENNDSILLETAHNHFLKSHKEINEAMAGQLCLAELEDRVARGVQLQAKLQQQGVV